MITNRSAKLAEKLLMTMLIAVIAAYLVGYGIINFWGFPLFCDTDMFADTTIAKLIWEQKSLFPEGWIFSNQYYVIATPVLCALFYGIVGNVNIAMALATELMTLLLLLSLCYVIRCFSKDLIFCLTGCLMLLSAALAPSGVASTHAQLLFIMASYYACYLVTFFVVLGDYIRAVQHPQLRRSGMWVVCLFLCFATGIQSLRETAILILPLIACELFFSLRRLFLKEKMWQLPSLIRVLSYAFANILGLLTTYILSPAHHLLYEESAPFTLSVLQNRAVQAWNGFRRVSGLQFIAGSDVSPFFGMWSLFLILLVLGAACLWLWKFRRQQEPLHICWLLSLVSVLAVTLSTVVTSTTMRPIYLFTWFAVVIFSVLLVLTHLPTIAKRVVILFLCVMSLGSLYHSYHQDVQLAIGFHKNPSQITLSEYHDVHPGTSGYDSQQLCQWAIEQGYEYVYGDWFTAPRVSVHSGGKLTAGYWWRSQPLHPLGYLNLQNIYGAEENAKAIYVVTDTDEDAMLAAAAEQGVTMTQVVTMGKYTAYTSPVPLMEGQTLSYE